MADPADDTLARNRWLALNLSRLGGVALTVLGILVLTDRVALPRALGWVVLAIGLFSTLALPQMLARRWRSPRP